MANTIRREIAAVRTETAELRRFGLLFFAILSLMTLYTGWRHSSAWTWTGGAAALFLMLALVRPGVLTRTYRAWMVLSNALGWINTRIILAVAFFLVLTPTAVALRLFRRDVLGKRFDKAAASYWLPRESAPNASHYLKQY
jgi:hypothetical protein